VESGSFVDGPGVRFVVFLAGCPLRCQYCHNPDAQRFGATRTTSEAVIAQIVRTAGFLKVSGGGVTVSGGEPLAQPVFAHDILAGAKALGLHTAVDTSGFLGDRMTDEMLDATDLVLLDIKSFDAATYREVTGAEVAPTLRLALRLSERCKPVWIRFVLVPGLTDEPANIRGLARFVARLSNVERVEIVPFHQMGRHKWEELGLPYRLADTRPAGDEDVARARSLFEAEGVSVGEGRFPPCATKAKAGVEHDEPAA
jgi:pyruvate formate lyase activating enzyme